ncbi:TIGR02646 family protein [Anabaena aphanizomenioides LEGE 00250]|uniref:TIGR02646 family protein n=1 Tax=Sphaerospermopsis aphanizomenoides LEGE 00250 TaxID=2777972 RepID=A0ABR9VGN4_9CYAN|nr:retron system putative HNH endonuclease [Sphaerospermopsis aphanizomenoides]MBE9237649.1 TIGR02646 family protein [Sphaerospermopsis aphanizomenoides LEGE 00250]
MKRIIKGAEPPCLLKYRQTQDANYDGYHPKEPLKRALLAEQGYICCYCMQRISIDDMEIEHNKARNKNCYPDLQLDYRNLIASCTGNRGKGLKNFHCNARKGYYEGYDKEEKRICQITLNPADANKNCENYIRYSSTGKIFSDDETINHELNNILNLNHEILVGNRKDRLFSVINALNKKFPNKTWSQEAIKKKLEELSSKDADDKYSPYCQSIVWYLSKRLNNP